MTFTDPIIAGEELTRQAIKSDNYIAGLAGWRIAKDGAAEFDNLGIRGNLWVPSITLNGQDLATLINKAPRGTIAWARGYPTTATTTEAAIMWLECDLVAGRYYEVLCTNLTPDIGNVKATEFRLRYVTSTTVWPDNNSPIATISLRLSQFELGTMRHMFPSEVTGRIRYRASIGSLDGANVRVWTPGEGATLAVIDHGISPAQSGSIGSVSPGGKVTKEFTITANASKCYLGNGTQRPADVYATTLIQGDFANGKGNQRSWFTFSAADLALLNDLIGVPLADIDIAEIKLTAVEYLSGSSARLSIGYHNQTSIAGSTEPPGGIPNVYNPVSNGYNPTWYNLKSPAPTNFLDSIRDGYLRGFMFGNTYSGSGYAMVCEGVGTAGNPPQLHIKYRK